MLLAVLLSGIVLMTQSSTQVIVRHEAFAKMPAMSMTFRVPPGTALQPGEHIQAEVDTSTEPWSLSSIRVVAAAPAAPNLRPPNFLNVGDRVPNIPFVDERGRPTTLAALRGRSYALTFIYTRCRDPKMCPFVSAKLHLLQTQTAGTKVALVEVSLDPAYDRPPVLARYGAMFGEDPARWELLTGDPRTVLDFAARFRILERSAGPTTIVHTERLAIVDSTGHITRFYDDPTWQPSEVAQQLARSS